MAAGLPLASLSARAVPRADLGTEGAGTGVLERRCSVGGWSGESGGRSCGYLDRLMSWARWSVGAAVAAAGAVEDCAVLCWGCGLADRDCCPVISRSILVKM